MYFFFNEIHTLERGKNRSKNLVVRELIPIFE